MIFVRAVVIACLIPTSLGLWPQPQESKHGNKTVWLHPSAKFTYETEPAEDVEVTNYFSPFGGFDGVRDFLQIPWLMQDHHGDKPLPSVDRLIRNAIKRTQKEIRSSKFVPWKFHPRNELFEPVQNKQDAVIRQVNIREKATNIPTEKIRDFIEGSENYQIKISADGEATITSDSPIATLRALQTFLQLFYTHSSGSGIYTPHAPISITDAPKWRYRGLNLDISRNSFMPQDLKRTIDAMASTKMNRLHVHATDSQSWPLDIPSMPSLAAKGAYHTGLVWSASDLWDLQLYGLERGVSVFLEIDLPGHTASIGYAFPDLVSAFLEEPWHTYTLEPPSGQIKLNSSAVYEFLDKLMDDLLPRVSPFTRYFHTGGDELNLNTYLLDETVKSNNSETIRPLLQKMVMHVHNKIRDAGLIPIVWEEMAIQWNLTLSSSSSSSNKPDVLVQAWRESAAVKKVLEKGYRTIFGPGDAWYLDCGYGSFFNPKPNSTTVRRPFLDWCAPLKNWRYMYVYDPLAGIPKDLQPLLEGGEAHMWSENVDPIVMDAMIWPRAAAAAEVLWTGPRTTEHIQDASYRLGEWRERAVIDSGVGASVVQMTYCLMREGSCEA
ncbi:hypothetical protein AJ80_06497 [Polytolypa hystricis UAMH7299]|uniref:Beta-hexosaminidase n=1 Tax=Polytolypa hystricis (strain UAMH7299) TaxID=1447883 RepID=A0A2B7XW45_POLH7|nr:hypothetical protein AJ80_06497 [Polytolypa hystricis UAMH7299]